MAFRWCLGGVRWCLDGVRWCLHGVQMVFRWCLGGVRWCLGGVKMVFRWCLGGGLQLERLVNLLQWQEEVIGEPTLSSFSQGHL